MEFTMNKKISIFVVLVALTFVLGLSSCTKDNSVTPTTDTEQFNYVSAGTNVDAIQVSDATLDEPIAIQNEMTPEVVNSGMLFGGKMPMFDFRKIFPKLNLTADQIAEIKVIMQDHKDCEKAARLAYFQQITAIISSFNQQRQDIIAQLKAGTIDRKTANQEIADLNKQVRQSIQASGANATLKEALKTCTQTMIHDIMALLNADQKVIFQQWISRITGGNG
jgi:Spy/CpxP family protein refolding chaperone